MSNVNKKFVFAFMAVVLICALIVPIVSVAPVAANPDVQVYFRVECPADEDTYRETGEYELIWAGYITVPTDVNITCKSGVEYHLYVNSSDRYVVERTSDGYTWDRGPADQNIGATSVLAALDEASTPENGNFTYEVLDTWFPGMGFFISAIDGHMGSGSVGWSYRVWNPDDAGLSPIAADSFLLGYNTMPIATPHEQVLWYWGGSGCGSPLRITSDKTAAGVGEEFTATVEYFRDYGHGPGGIWETLAGATIDVGSETFTTDDNGTAKIFLESTGTYELSARKGFDGNSYYVPSDDRTEVSVSGGDTSSWWTQTTQTDFSSGTPYQVNTSVSPGDVKLERGGTVTDDYILDGGTETLGGEYFYDNFTIKNGTTLYVADGESLIVHANHIYIDSSSKIDADGRGYDGGSGSTGNGDGGFGPGAGSRGVHSGVHGGGGSGAGYAGAGGCGSDGWSEKAAGGYKYGGTCQSGDHSFYLGSGGGGGGGDGSSNAGGDGGDGGGAVRLEANTIDIDGEITAAGEDGSDGIAAGCGGGGGGSGGTIYIAGSDINIANGALTVQGGDGGDGGGTNGHGGGGGSGGHIKVFYENVNDSSGHHGYYSSGGTGDPYNGRGDIVAVACPTPSGSKKHSLPPRLTMKRAH
jgi:hypothetical protein